MQQDQEVADFLRHFVGDDRDRGDDAQLGVGHERGGDQYAIDKIVEGVADEDHQSAAAVVVMAVSRLRRDMRIVGFAFLDMAMTPQHQFFEDKEAEDAEQHGGCGGLDAFTLIEGVRQHFDEGGA